MKLGVSSYSFTGAVRNGRMRFLDIPSKAAELGFDVVEFFEFILPEGEESNTFAEKLAKESEKVGIPIVHYSAGADLLSGSGGMPSSARS